MKGYIPLTKESEWACMRILEHNNDSIFAFPRYTSVNGCKANSASAALNKWLKSKLKDDYVVHGFRHSFRDRLRAKECPSEIIDQLGISRFIYESWKYELRATILKNMSQA